MFYAQLQYSPSYFVLNWKSSVLDYESIKKMCERVERERGRAVVHEYVQCTGGEMMQYHGASYIVDMMTL